ncbi:MAG: Hsp20/alpha crystallin family protein, partial [Verrucomicrobiota bacterium]
GNHTMQCQVNQNEQEQQSARKPAYTTAEHDHGFTVEVYVPGVGKDGVSVSYEDDVLDVTAKRGDSQVPEGWKLLRREIPQADYRLRLKVNLPVDADQISAKVEDGLLTLSLPKAEEAKPRQIAVE